MLVRNVYLKILNQFSVATHLMTRRLEPAMMTIYSNFDSSLGAMGSLFFSSQGSPAFTEQLLYTLVAKNTTLGINRHIVRESLGV